MRGSAGVPVGTISAALSSGWAEYRLVCGTQTVTPPLRGNINVTALPPATSLPPPLASTAVPHISGWIDRFGRRAEEGDLNGSISARINEPTQQFHNLLKRFYILDSALIWFERDGK